jgi:hypothetical protein
MPLLPEETIPYKTWVKTSIVEALKPVFANHPDEKIRGTKVSIDYPTSRAHYPAVIVRFFEQQIQNAGVGHVEYILINDSDPYRVKFRHFLYKGSIEFAIFGLSSLDRDLISDTIVQTIAMSDMASYTRNFWDRIYFPDTSVKSDWNYVNLNTDELMPMGEQQTPQPWLSEDQLVYQTGYRVGIYGEFYNLPPTVLPAGGVIEKVTVYPYYPPDDPLPTGTDDPADWGMADSIEPDPQNDPNTGWV